MAYCFERKESVSKAARRVACERLDHAIGCLREPGRMKAIHGARKDLKKTRAVLRLVRTRVSKKHLRRLTSLLHKAARPLSAPRDALVKVQTAQFLLSHFKGELAPKALRHVRSRLRHDAEKELKRFAQKKTASAVERTLRRAIVRVNALDIRGEGWTALGPGVKAAYRQGRHAYWVALVNPAPANFHRWRKRAKDLWCQVRLLRPVWREQMEAMAGELDTLDEKLGDDHDLVLLQQEIDGRAVEAETLLRLIAQRQGELRAAALAVGSRFYHDKPSAFCERLAGYWHTWRKERKRTPTSATVAA